MNRTRTLTVTALAGLALAVVPAVGAGAAVNWMDPKWPDAQISATSPNYAGSPVGYDISATGGWSTAGLTFEFDYEDDGVYDLTWTDRSSVEPEHTFAEPGAYTTRVRVTDDLSGDVSEGTTRFVVSPTAVRDAPKSPGAGAPTIPGATIDRDTVMRGRAVTVTVPHLTADQAFTVRLVPFSAGSWNADPLAEYGPFVWVTTAKVTIDRENRKGLYRLLVTTSAGEAAGFTVTAEDTDAAFRAEEAATQAKYRAQDRAQTTFTRWAWLAVTGASGAAIALDLTRSARGRRPRR